MKQRWRNPGIPAAALAVAALLCAWAAAQQIPHSRMLERGTVQVKGQEARYLIRRLPVSTFTELPADVAAELNRQDCMIPQSYQAHRAENVVHGSFAAPGTLDWAALCSAGGQVRLLVFFSSAPQNPMTLDEADEKSLLQPHDPSGELGFAWGLDAATPAQVHEAQAGLEHRPPPPSHDAVALTWIDHWTRYRLYEQGRWIELEMPQ